MAQRKGPLDIAVEKKIKNKNGLFLLEQGYQTYSIKCNFILTSIKTTLIKHRPINGYQEGFVTFRYKFSLNKNTNREVISGMTEQFGKLIVIFAIKNLSK